MRKITFLILTLVLGSCSANWHVKRAIAKDPGLLQDREVLRIDTTVITRERILTDTVVLNDVDSVIIEKDRVITKIWRDHDTIRVVTICPGDTVRILVEKECDPVINYTPETKRGTRVILASLIGLLLLVLALITKRIFRR